MHADDARERTSRYHDRTKHGMGRYARSLGYMDWQTQPHPYRRYEGADLVVLDEIPVAVTPTFDEMLAPSETATVAPGLDSVSRLFYDALALSAWKSDGGNRWSLRCNPSSGNLHPTEGYLLVGPEAGLDGGGGLFHYSPLLHGLERRLTIDESVWRRLITPLPEGAILVGLSSIHWRESWKYGERAFRYCQHDVGHALAALSYAAATMGWAARLLESVTDEQISVLLGIDGQDGPEREHPDGVLAILPAGYGLTDDEVSWTPEAGVLDEIREIEHSGTPNRLSSAHHDWPVIDEVALATGKHEAGPQGDRIVEGPSPASFVGRDVSAREIFRQRRSAVDFDGDTWIDDDALFRMLAATMPSAARPPLSTLPWTAGIHLVLFVHRVRGLEPGLYALVRREGALTPLQDAFDGEHEWAHAGDGAGQLPFFRLVSGDYRSLARSLSCQQDIAGDGAFAVAMVSEMGERLDEIGAWFYRRLFWEAGAIGQIFYDEAEAAGVRATGIGCFFDDEVHEVLGLAAGSPWQVLYHLTVGGPVEDGRIQTLPAYDHRDLLLARLRGDARAR